MTDSFDRTLSAESTIGDHSQERGLPPQLERGSQLGRYVVLSKLGAGGMGVVYGAFDPKLGRRVALKLLHGYESGVRKSAGHDRLLREAQAMAKLTHRNTVAIHDVGVHAGRVFLAMEYISGRTLRELMREDQPGWREVLQIFREAAAGLVAAHDAGLVHRDFKPENVTVDDAGRVRVMDFGLAAPSGDTSSGHSHPDDSAESGDRRRPRLVGTPAYMAPEQFEGGIVGQAADQFAFCVALYEALYGVRPFPGASAVELARSVSRGEMRSPPRSDVPNSVRRAVLRGLATNPGERHASMRELCERLETKPRRWLWLAVGGGALATGAAGLVLGTQLLERRDRAGCREAARQLDDDWNDAVREQLDAAIRLGGAPAAGVTAHTVKRSLDAYADRWSSARETACVAVRVDEAWEPAAVARADACFDATRAAFAELIARALVADFVVQAGLGWAGSRLPRPEDCADGTRLLQQADPHRTSPEVVTALATAAAAEALEDWPTIAGIADELLADGVEAYEPAIAVRLLLLRGRARFAATDIAGARAASLDALTMAYGAGIDEVAFLAAIALAQLELYGQEHLDQARSWLRVARLILRRSGQPTGTEDWAKLHLWEGKANIVGHRLAEAREALDVAAAHRAGLYPPDHPLVIEVARVRAGVATGEGDYDRALRELSELIPVAERVWGGDHPKMAGLIRSVAVAHAKKGDARTAAAELQRALDILTATYGADSGRTATAKYQLGTQLAALSRYDEAEVVLRGALASASPATASATRRGEILIALAGAVWAQGRVDEARQVLGDAIEAAEAGAQKNHALLAAAHANLGAVEKSAGDGAASRSHLALALAAAQRARRAEPVLVVEIETALAQAELDGGEAAASLRHFEGAVERAEQARITGVPLASARWGLSRALVELDREPARVAALLRSAARTLGDARGDKADMLRERIVAAMSGSQPQGVDSAIDEESAAQ